jgi:hypothetical protein
VEGMVRCKYKVTALYRVWVSNDGVDGVSVNA